MTPKNAARPSLPARLPADWPWSPALGALAALLALLPLPATANVAVVLVNGNRMEVRAAFEVGDQVRLDLLDGGSIRLPATSVKRISANAADLPASAAGALTIVGAGTAAPPPVERAAIQPEIPTRPRDETLLEPPVDRSVLEPLFARSAARNAVTPPAPGASAAARQEALHRALTPRRGMTRELLTKYARPDEVDLGRPARETVTPGSHSK